MIGQGAYEIEEHTYLPAARRCQRVRFSIFLCFFLRMRLRRFLMRDPMTGANGSDRPTRCANRRESARAAPVSSPLPDRG